MQRYTAVHAGPSGVWVQNLWSSRFYRYGARLPLKVVDRMKLGDMISEGMLQDIEEAFQFERLQPEEDWTFEEGAWVESAGGAWLDNVTRIEETPLVLRYADATELIDEAFVQALATIDSCAGLDSLMFVRDKDKSVYCRCCRKCGKPEAGVYQLPWLETRQENGCACNAGFTDVRAYEPWSSYTHPGVSRLFRRLVADQVEIYVDQFAGRIVDPDDRFFHGNPEFTDGSPKGFVIVRTANTFEIVECLLQIDPDDYQVTLEEAEQFLDMVVRRTRYVLGFTARLKQVITHYEMDGEIKSVQGGFRTWLNQLDVDPDRWNSGEAQTARRQAATLLGLISFEADARRDTDLFRGNIKTYVKEVEWIQDLPAFPKCEKSLDPEMDYMRFRNFVGSINLLNSWTQSQIDWLTEFRNDLMEILALRRRISVKYRDTWFAKLDDLADLLIRRQAFKKDEERTTTSCPFIPSFPIPLKECVTCDFADETNDDACPSCGQPLVVHPNPGWLFEQWKSGDNRWTALASSMPTIPFFHPMFGIEIDVHPIPLTPMISGRNLHVWHEDGLTRFSHDVGLVTIHRSVEIDRHGTRKVNFGLLQPRPVYVLNRKTVSSKGNKMLVTVQIGVLPAFSPVRTRFKVGQRNPRGGWFRDGIEGLLDVFFCRWVEMLDEPRISSLMAHLTGYLHDLEDPSREFLPERVVNKNCWGCKHRIPLPVHTRLNENEDDELVQSAEEFRIYDGGRDMPCNPAGICALSGQVVRAELDVCNELNDLSTDEARFRLVFQHKQRQELVVASADHSPDEGVPSVAIKPMVIHRSRELDAVPCNVSPWSEHKSSSQTGPGVSSEINRVGGFGLVFAPPTSGFAPFEQ